ncbi:MAG: HAD family hydrolase, partial [Trueperaceae bacterium]
EATGIAEYFDSILISGNLGFAKPDPRIFSLAADSLGVSSRECIFVGDNPERDIVGAGRSGMRTVWISHGIRWPERLGPAPAAILQSPSDLLGTVDALCARNEM